MRKRTIHINLRTTPEENKELKRKAKKCGLSVSEYLRQRGLGYEPQSAPTKEYAELTRLMTDLYSDFQTSGDETLTNLLAETLLELQATINPVKKNGNN